MTRKLFPLFLLTISSWAADATQIRTLLQSALSDTAPAPIINHMEELSTASDLPAADIASILPLAIQCLRSPTANQYGASFLVGVTTRSDALQLLEPYADQFEAIASGPGGPLRTSTFTILTQIIAQSIDDHGEPVWDTTQQGEMTPKLRKILDILNNHLEDKSNSRDDVAEIGDSLIKASSSDAAVIHKVLSIAEKRSEVHVRIVIMNAIGLSRTHNPDALDFIGKNLDSENRDVREQAIAAVWHLDRDVRVEFVAKHAAQFGWLAADSEIRPEARKQAADAIAGREMR
jgi:hypothetical protein